MTTQSDTFKGIASVPNSSLYDVKLPFPYKLHDLLDDAVLQGYDSIISWLPHGKAFRVHRPKAFAAMIMPRHFKQSKYKSFQRQLHIYGFLRINSRDMKDYGAYYHPMFLRGKRDDSLIMQRQPSSTSKEKLSSKDRKVHPVSDPDFYNHMPTPPSGSLNEEWGRKLPAAAVNYSSNLFQKSEANGNVHIIPAQQQQHMMDQVAQSAHSLLSNLRPVQGTSFQSTGSSSSCFSTSAEAPLPDLQQFLLPSTAPLPAVSSSSSSSLLGQNIIQAEEILSQMYGRPTTRDMPKNTFSSIVNPIPSEDRPVSPFTAACNELFEDSSSSIGMSPLYMEYPRF